jgi:hypothetical protein
MYSIEQGSTGEFEFHAFPRMSINILSADEIHLKPEYIMHYNNKIIRPSNNFEVKEYGMYDISNTINRILSHINPISVNIIISMININNLYKWNGNHASWYDYRYDFSFEDHVRHRDTYASEYMWDTFSKVNYTGCKLLNAYSSLGGSKLQNRRRLYEYKNKYDFNDFDSSIIPNDTLNRLSKLNMWFLATHNDLEIIYWFGDGILIDLYTISQNKKIISYICADGCLQIGDSHTNVFVMFDTHFVISNVGDAESVIVIEKKS